MHGFIRRLAATLRSCPTTRPRTGTVVVEGQKPIPFCNFMASSGLVVLERGRPDTHGARKTIIALTAIVTVKLTDTDPISAPSALGFC